MLIVIDSSGVEIERVEDTVPEPAATVAGESCEPRPELGLAVVEVETQ